MKIAMVINFVILLILNIFSFCYAQDGASIYLAILLDASGSMRDTDPDDLRKLAAQTTVALMTDNDRVAILQFAADGKILAGWTSPKRRRELFDAIDRAGDDGIFTDFRAGLNTALHLFQDVPAQPNTRKIILLLSDGLFEPDLHSTCYAPYHLQYSIAIKGKGSRKRKEIRKKFTAKVLPTARRIIRENIVPALNSGGIEVYTIALSEEADRNFLRKIAEVTSRNKTELHSFEVIDPLDLTDTFLEILRCAQNRLVLHSEDGTVSPFTKQLYIDEFVNEPLFVLISNTSVGGFYVKSQNNLDETAITETHRALQLIPITAQKPPGKWQYGFANGDGQYKLLVVGQSLLSLDVIGLRNRYATGETVKVTIVPTYNGENVTEKLSKNSTMTANVWSKDTSPEQIELQRSDEGYSLTYLPLVPGNFRLKFDLNAETIYGKKLLPRSTRTYIINVMPRVFVEPDYIFFGDVQKGDSAKSKITIHYGLAAAGTMEISSRITGASRMPKDSALVPIITTSKISLKPGDVVDRNISIYVPQKCNWGDYQGEIQLKVNGRRTGTLTFIVHIPSFWEKIRVPIFIFVIPLILLLLLLIYYRIKLGNPRGILRVMKTPAGNVLPDIELFKVKGGFIRRFFSKHPHIVSFMSKGGDINLLDISRSAKMELIFYRIPNTKYIKNDSLPDSGVVLKIEDPSFGAGSKISLEPGKLSDLINGQKIEFEGYLFKYECL